MSQFTKTEIKKLQGRRKVVDKFRDFQKLAETAEPQDFKNIFQRIIVFIYRYVFILGKSLQRDELLRHASSLAYATVLSIFPLLAVVSSTLSIIYTENREETFYSFLEERLLPSMMEESTGLVYGPTIPVTETAATNEDFRMFFRDVSDRFRQSASGAGIFGFVGLFLTALLLYANIENAVNNTWKTENRGNVIRTLTTFTTTMFFFPILIGLSIAASTLAIALLEDETPRVMQVDENGETVYTDFESLPMAYYDDPAWGETENDAMALRSQQATSHPVIQKLRIFTVAFGFLLPLFNVLLTALVLSFAYMALPKTKVSFRYAFLGGLTAALLWEAARYIFFVYVQASFVNRSIVEALGASILFLIWIYVTWVILLLGNEITYVSQNFRDLVVESLSLKNQTTIDGRLLLAVLVLLARRFQTIGGGLTEEQIRRRLGLSQPDLDYIMKILSKENYVSQMMNGGYQLIKSPESIFVKDIIARGCDLSVTPIGKRSQDQIAKLFRNIQDRMLNICENMKLSELVDSDRDIFSDSRETIPSFPNDDDQ